MVNGRLVVDRARLQKGSELINITKFSKENFKPRKKIKRPKHF